MSNQHGGPRPKQRADDQRGGSGRGQGRKPEIAKLRKGDTIIVERETMGGLIQQPQRWQVLSIGGDDGNIIEFQSGDDIIVFRPPDE